MVKILPWRSVSHQNVRS